MFDTDNGSKNPMGFYIETTTSETEIKVFAHDYCVNTWNVTVADCDTTKPFDIDFSIKKGLVHAEVILNSKVLSEKAIDILKNCRIRPVDIGRLQVDYEYLFIEKLNGFPYRQFLNKDCVIWYEKFIVDEFNINSSNYKHENDNPSQIEYVIYNRIKAIMDYVKNNS